MDTDSRRVKAKLVGVLMRHFRERHLPNGKRARLSQEGLLELMGSADQTFSGTYDRSTVSKWETGKVLPSRERLEVFGKALNLSAAEVGGLIRLADLDPKDGEGPDGGTQALEGCPGASQGELPGSGGAEAQADGTEDGLSLHTVGPPLFSAAWFLARRSFITGVVCVLASITIALGVLVGTGRLAFSDDSLIFNFEGKSDVKADFGAEVQDIWLSPSIVNMGESADIKAKVRNLSPSSGPYGGEATFDVVITVRPPSGPEIGFLWNNSVFSYNKVAIYEKLRYKFDQAGTYTIYAEVYSNTGQENRWLSDDRFASLTKTLVIASSSAGASPEFALTDYWASVLQGGH